MNRDIKISNDGTIFEIKDDGSISKLARISESGTVVPLNAPTTTTTNNTSRGNGGLWFFLVVFIIATVAFAGSYFALKDEYNTIFYQLQSKNRQYSSQKSTYESQISDLERKVSSAKDDYNSKIYRYESQISDLNNDVSSLKSEVSTLKSKIQRIGNKVPFIVTDIKMGNMNGDGSMYTDYGITIYSSSSMYLSPRIYYDGIKSGSYTIYWKIFKPDGQISRGDSSPSGYSTSGTIYINEGDGNYYSMSGWGGTAKGHWSKGTYRIEIWYNDTCVKSKKFTIY